MRCPYCGSTDVECHSNARSHVHVCTACGVTITFAGKPKQHGGPMHQTGGSDE